MSNNLANYGDIPEDAVIRINLAWINSLSELVTTISSVNNKIFLDLPIGRTKPPNNSYSLVEIREIVLEYNNVKYLAISNVESSKDIMQYIELFRKSLIIVPKIETKKGVENISSIVEVLGQEKVVMLDHDDLFLDLSRNNIPASEFFSYIERLDSFCREESVKLLRMRGVIFSDGEKFIHR